MERAIWIITNFIVYGELCAVVVLMCFMRPANLIGWAAMAIFWAIVLFAFFVFTIEMQKARKIFSERRS